MVHRCGHAVDADDIDALLGGDREVHREEPGAERSGVRSVGRGDAAARVGEAGEEHTEEAYGDGSVHAAACKLCVAAWKLLPLGMQKLLLLMLYSRR